MKNPNFAVILIAPLLALTGCPWWGSPDPDPPNTVPITGTTVTQLCERDCERAPKIMLYKNVNYHSINFNQNESASLSRALPKGAPASGAIHLHATVVNGSLVFTPDSNPAHTGSTTTTLALAPNGSKTGVQLKIVATPEAEALLHQRIHP